MTVGGTQMPRVVVFENAAMLVLRGVEVQYSVDRGLTWSLVHSECMMSTDIACTSYVLSSDVYYDWTRVAISLPYYTRSDNDTIIQWPTVIAATGRIAVIIAHH